MEYRKPSLTILGDAAQTIRLEKKAGIVFDGQANPFGTVDLRTIWMSDLFTQNSNTYQFWADREK